MDRKTSIIPPAKSVLPNSPQQSSAVCGCGKQLVANSKHSTEASNRRLTIALWSLLFAVAIGGSERLALAARPPAKHPLAVMKANADKNANAAKKQLAIELAEASKAIARAKTNELFSGEAAEFIWRRMVGTWTWGKEHTIDFAPDGTFVENGPAGEDVISRGLWNVDQDGTVRVSHDNKFSAKVKILTGSNLSIVATDPNGKSWQMAGHRRSVYGKLLDTTPEDRYIRKQVQALKQHRGNPKLSGQAADNLTALGPFAGVAVTELASAVLHGKNMELKRKAMAALGEIGHPGMEAIVQTLLLTADAEIGAAAEDALLRLLPTAGKTLSMDDALLLLKVYESAGHQRLAPAIESAWASRGLTREAVANEPNKRLAQRQRAKQEWAELRKAQADPAFQARMAARAREDQEKLAKLREPPPEVAKSGPVKIFGSSVFKCNRLGIGPGCCGLDCGVRTRCGALRRRND